MSNPRLQVLIMAGGSGSRLRPESRSKYPKQFQALTGSQTMLQVTAQRVEPLTGQTPLVVCNEEHRFIAAEQMRGIDTPCEIILEPVGRNTAPRSGWPRCVLAKVTRTRCSWSWPRTI